MRISDWSSDVCSSDLLEGLGATLGPSRRVFGKLSPSSGRTERDKAGYAAANAIPADTARLYRRGAGAWIARHSDGRDRQRVVYGKTVCVSVNPSGRAVITQNTQSRNNYQPRPNTRKID